MHVANFFVEELGVWVTGMVTVNWKDSVLQYYERKISLYTAINEIQKKFNEASEFLRQVTAQTLELEGVHSTHYDPIVCLSSAIFGIQKLQDVISKKGTFTKYHLVVEIFKSSNPNDLKKVLEKGFLITFYLWLRSIYPSCERTLNYKDEHNGVAIFQPSLPSIMLLNTYRKKERGYGCPVL